MREMGAKDSLGWRMGAATAGLCALLASPPAQAELAFAQRGEASFYSDRLHGKRTASGQRFRQDRDTAAHRTLPLGSRVTVTNEATGQSVEVTVTDRGPHVRGRIVDLSRQAAEAIGLQGDGVTRVRLEAKPSAQPTRRLREAVATLARRQSRPRE
jgi:rare lipoprotein A